MPQWLSDRTRYGLIPVVLHWVTVVIVLGLFGSGLWMVELDYYSTWYQRAPDLHRSFGVLLMGLTALRLIVRLRSTSPAALASTPKLEALLASVVHWVFYAALFLIGAAGYLISTADGRSVQVFGLFDIPASLTSVPNQEELAGDIHYWLAVGLIILVSLHALAACRHHFLRRDETLRRMLGQTPRG